MRPVRSWPLRTTNLSHPRRTRRGKNYAYRTYFHGGKEDLPKTDALIGESSPLEKTHLSAAFPSTATGLWKVAVSTPIHLSQDSSSTSITDAVFVVTINLGDFELLQSEQGANQVAVLVEAREGLERGTILQHPLMDQRRIQGIRRKDQRYQIDSDLMDSLIAGRDVSYRDPVAKADDGKAYMGEWIAAMQLVELPRSQAGLDEPLDEKWLFQTTTNKNNTDLLVLVQYRLEKVMAPVVIMQSTLLLEGASALASILLVTLVLWWFVRRVSVASPTVRGDMKPSTGVQTETIASGSR